MRIGIDARFFGPVGKGLGRYTAKLIEHLEGAADDHEFVIFLRRENFDLYHPATPRFRKVLADFPWYGFAEQVRFPSLIRRERLDLMHFPHFNVPLFVPCPFVVTIHDLILLRYPTRRATTLNRLTYALKYAAYRLVIRRAVRASRKIIAVSECTKEDVLRHFRVPPDKIAVTYEAAGPPAPASSAVRPSLPDGPPYFLYVGNAYPHKNLERLIAAFARLKREGLAARLVLVGREDYFYGRLKREAEERGEADGVVFRGFAADAELPALYRGARAYVFPSLLEGFGLPPLEAMREGTPVAAARGSCLPEILGDAAAWFDPEDADDMARVMRRVFEDEPLRAELSRRGLERVQRFSWKTCAEETRRVYQEALSTPHAET